MDTRTRILHAAAELLSASAEADVSTRAVCEAAGVGAPTLYRQFGDKEGLLLAVVDFGFEQYLASKRALVPSIDPVADLRSGWDNHVAFARENPNYYRLMYSPGLSVPPTAAAEAHQLLLAVLQRCARTGRLAVSVDLAGQMVMSANAGVALSLISRPAIYTDELFSPRVRDAVIDSVLADRAPADSEPQIATTVAAAASTLAASLPVDARSSPLSAAENTLLKEWLHALANQ